MASRRIKQVNELIREELSQIFLKELELPLGVMATISRVKTSADLKSAKVWLSIIPGGQAQEILKSLQKKAGYIQSLLGKKVILKFTPKPTFVLDDSGEKAEKITRLLDEIKE